MRRRGINWTRPRRVHVIRNGRGWYVTVIAFGRRFHFTSGPAVVPDEPLWSATE